MANRALVGQADMVEDGGGGGTVTLTVPCRAEYVALCRLAVGALGAQEGLDEETVADLKLALTEACTCFIGNLERDEREDPGVPEPCLRIDLTPTSSAWTVSVSNPDRHCRLRSGCFADPMSEGALGLTIIRALVHDLEQTDSEETGSLVRFVRRL